MLTRTGFPVLLIAALALAWLPAATCAQSGQASEPFPLVDYQNESDFLPSTPSVFGGAVGAFANPAAWATGDRAETAFWWNDRSFRNDALDNWGFSHGRTLGFAFNRQTIGHDGQFYQLDDYQLGLALGDRRGHFGLAYRWSSSELSSVPREDALVIGFILRPNRWYSLGVSGLASTESAAQLAVADIGIRPLGRDWLTFFGDYSLRNGSKLEGGSWGAGVEIRPLPGLHLGIKFRDLDAIDVDYRTTFNIGITLSDLGFHVLPGYNDEGDLTHTTFVVRQHPSYRSLPVDLSVLRRAPRYVSVNLENRRLTYQRYRWFDNKRVAWLDLARRLDAIRDEKNVRGVVVNLAGFSARPSLAWELRQKLLELRQAGKEIIIHIDRVSMLGYYVASMADFLTMDPLGDVVLPGLAMKRTYLRGALDKLGIGIQEFRYFTHKSAFESLSRTSMSDADREQRQRVVDVIYEMVRQGACEGRSLAPQQFDAIVDDEVFLTAAKARELGLVDRIARWGDVGELLAEERDGGRLWTMPAQQGQRVYNDEVWGRPPKVVVVYAVGLCDMDEGIKGRATSAFMRRLAKDPEVAAVVLRADSPGGDGLPSDLVAEAITILQKAGKPVIVSQGDLAASGGYWISMNGDKILTTPATLTGSIGVIGGWLWDDGIGEKAGLSSDGVWRGDHADLFSGLRFPILGAGIPTRPLNEQELALVKNLMLSLYSDFVVKVAVGRGLDEATVRRLGEGRVWMGVDAVENGLVDGYGGLQDAIILARQMAGIDPGEEVALVEYPPRPLIEWPSFGPKLPELFSILAPVIDVFSGLRGGPAESAAAADAPLDPEAATEDYDLLYWRTLATHAGAPVLITPPDALPAEWLGGK